MIYWQKNNGSSPLFFQSLGVYPWKAGSEDVEDIINYLDDISIIGDIGLDNVWTNVDINIQKNVFYSSTRKGL